MQRMILSATQNPRERQNVRTQYPSLLPATTASASVIAQYTLAATLWWMIVLWLVVSFDIPPACCPMACRSTPPAGLFQGYGESGGLGQGFEGRGAGVKS